MSADIALPNRSYSEAMLHYGARCPTRVELSLLHEGLLRFEENLTTRRDCETEEIEAEPLSERRLGQDSCWILFTIRIIQEGAAQLPATLRWNS